MGAVDACGRVVVSVGGGERQAGGSGRQEVLPGRRLVLQAQRELLLLAGQLEAVRGHVELLPSVGELHLQQIPALAGEGVDVLQTQPELACRDHDTTSQISECARYATSSHTRRREPSDTPTVQVAEAVLVALPQLVEVLGAVVAFLDDGPRAVWEERRGYNFNLI